MRIVTAAVISLALSSSAVLASDNAYPLAPGKPAGVHNAQLGDNTLLIALGAGAFIAAVAVLASDSGNNNITSSPTTTTTTTTTGTG
jgi:hypothetical protein